MMTFNEVDAPAGDADPRLAPVLRATGTARDREIERLILDVARPVATAILGHYRRAWSSLRHQDVDDIAAMVDARFLEKLRALDADAAIQDLDRYVATLTYNAINDHLRRAFPERARLKNRLRHLLQRDARFGLWSEGGALVAALAGWERAPRHDALIELRDADITRTMRNRDRASEAVAEILAKIGGPVAFDRLVEFVARLWHVVDAAPVIADASIDRREDMNRRQTLLALWKEIVALPPMQRKALLLNLRGPETINGVLLLVVSRIASFDELAATLEMTAEELAELWNDLPLTDDRIAAILGVTRQQVINLRKSARARLGRRVGR